MFASSYRISFAARWKRQYNVVVLISLFLVAANVFGQTKQPKEKIERISIKGNVVAESIDFTARVCWHVCTLNLVVMIRDGGEDRLVRVDVEYSDEGSMSGRGEPSHLLASGKVWTLTGVADRPAERLDRFVKIVDQNGNGLARKRELPAWRMLDGFENITLPFGNEVPYLHVRLNDSFTEINNEQF